MTMITPSYLGETIEYSSLHACRSTLEDPTILHQARNPAPILTVNPKLSHSPPQTLLRRLPPSHRHRVQVSRTNGTKGMQAGLM